MNDENLTAMDPAAAPGLRGRKKSKRRHTIIEQAKILFEDKGIDATTMAEIAAASEVSTPTVFNYFGSKDSILLAMISDGIRENYAVTSVIPRPEAADLDARKTGFVALLVDAFAGITDATMQIAPKRIWRYAESSVIRRPNTELAAEYAMIEDRLLKDIAAFVEAFDLRLLTKEAMTAEVLTRCFHDSWNPTFFDFVKSPEQTISEHKAKLAKRFTPLCQMIFHPDFLASPQLKKAA